MPALPPGGGLERLLRFGEDGEIAVVDTEGQTLARGRVGEPLDLGGGCRVRFRGKTPAAGAQTGLHLTSMAGAIAGLEASVDVENTPGTNIIRLSRDIGSSFSEP